MKCITLLLLFSVYTVNIQATTHWMVTESGFIQPKIDSPFEMARPHDLLAFLNQDTRWGNIINIYHDLSIRQANINKLWSDLEKNTDFTTHLSLEENCVKAGSLHLLDWYLSCLEDGRTKNIPEEEYLLRIPSFGHATQVPDCKKISSLTFSMFAFEHLEGMIHRENLTASPDASTLPESIASMTMDGFGHWVSTVLKRNSSSWLHYNMASLYWRATGNAAKAMECSRRAVHYAPRKYKDTALLSMGTIFHRSKKTDDAITILGAAVDHDPQYGNNHFMLANAYAVLGDFNSSLKHLDLCLKLNPGYELAIQHKYGVMCHASLVKKMEVIGESLTKLREALSEYSLKEAHWLKSQAAFLRTMKHAEEYDYRNVEQNCAKMTEIIGLNIKEMKKDGDRNSLIQYFLDGPLFKDKWLTEKGVHVLEAAHSMQRLMKHIQKHANMASDFVIHSDQLKVTEGMIVKEIGPMPVMPDITRGHANIEEIKTESQHVSVKSTTSQYNAENQEFETGIALYPTTMKINRNLEEFDVNSDWPSISLCKEAASSFPGNVEAIYPVFLPFENKGIRLNALLTEKIGVPASVEHDLPWHPPTCPQGKEHSAATQKKPQKPHLINEVVPSILLRQKLLEYVGDGRADLVQHMQDAEIGQRIHTVIENNLAPKWLTYTLASLYWRVRGNNINALNCLLSASRTAKPQYKDIVLASLASVYLEMGHFDEALVAAEEAFRLSLYEPVTNFILAELNMVKKHRNTHMFHLKQVVRVEPGFMDGLARSLLNRWGCINKQVNSLQEMGLEEGEVCTQVEPGVTMVCKKDGTNCKRSGNQCFTSNSRESSAIVRMLENAADSMEEPADYLDASIFDPFISRMPEEPSNVVEHNENFQNMMTTIDKVLRGCGLRGCSSIQPEDLALKEEDCSQQHLQFGFWLHIMSFRQMFSDSDLRIPPEIQTLTPSIKKVPDCRLNNPKQDFFLERLSQVDTEDWDPVLSLMHQFTEKFSFCDYMTLGAKIAKYIDSRPRSWTGALVAGWWCGADGRGACALRCLSAAYALAPPPHAVHVLRALSALLHMQSKWKDAKDVAYLAFYMSPKSKIESVLVAVSHTFMEEYEQAVWMYRYALTFDGKYLPAKACLHATMCLMLFGTQEPKEN